MFSFNNKMWKIRLVDCHSPILVREDGSISVGVTEPKTNTVYIADNLQPDFFHKVLTHELVHCAMASYNVNLSVDVEEIIADIFATYGREIISKADLLFKMLAK